MSHHYQNYIDGHFIDAGSSGQIEIYNPATQGFIGTVSDSTSDAVDAAVSAARVAQRSWAKLPAIERAGHLRAISAKIRQHVDRLAEIITREQGKTLELARVEVSFTADYIDYMAEWGRRIEGEVITSDRVGETIFMLRKPLGVVAGILPWNFPFFLIARKMAPALITGNTIVIKPSEESPINAYEFAKLVDETDLPKGVFNLVNGRGASVGATLTGHADINMVSFTGSVDVGMRIMGSAAKNMTRVNLELGGKAPVIVLEDADLNLAAKAIWDSRITNTGQLCNCAERIYVASSVADELTAKIATHMKSTRFGDPLSQSDLHMGPLINKQALHRVDAMVQRALAEGAELVTGGRIAGRDDGFHYEPTVLMNCSHKMEIMHKEVFGPVIPIQKIDSLEEAIQLANDSQYGLTSSIFTRNLNHAMQACHALEFGETYVNREHFEAMQGFHAGRRKSGIGGADGKHGLYEHLETQVVYMNHGQL
ncbi:aldehyde dehydrogenase [Glaciimonas immobilis]|uniref:Lactaldehyde dehydrogenase/glycolaldehyde dehydrogenase n=1 Tax=Glaciimonas immobilis TaxID=728004 RepID=A0A840RY75_9BURK|nr:aldehyde dehydrogenase [Glaciimonas immobilis]KAF3996052.1 aldehyde dehydrogenase [Glaciimonas immobilis]MBB5201816.1 lactaldehyde dehydrogenase/glycolaldehyde dehydrogenase [Glaciimonas immobilis]